MPAGSDPTQPPPSPGDVPSLPHTWRPLGPMVMGIVLLVGLFTISALSWIGFDERTKASFTVFEKGTVLFFGLLILVLVHALIRSRVEARREKLVVVNGYRKREFEWAQIVAVNLPTGAPWVTLDLTDGTNVAAMGIQASDGARARTAARQLRQLAGQLG